jgi:hypothetical protein
MVTAGDLKSFLRAFRAGARGRDIPNAVGRELNSGDEGFEPSQNGQNTAEKRDCPNSGAANASAPLCPPMVADAELRTLVEAWPNLPSDVRKMISTVAAATVNGPRK